MYVNFIDAVDIITCSTVTGNCSAFVGVERLPEALGLLHRLQIVFLRLDAICSLHIHILYLVATVALVGHVGNLISIKVIA